MTPSAPRPRAGLRPGARAALAAAALGLLGLGPAAAPPGAGLDTASPAAPLPLVLAGVDDEPPAAAPWPEAPGARRFHVDSERGDDRLDGRSAEPGGRGHGPWRSLARLAAARLQPGDQVLLACGSRWHETLRLADSGVAGRPIVVRAAEPGCAEPPTVDGAVELPPHAFTRRGGGEVVEAAFAPPVRQVFAGDEVLLEAHHPDQGPSGDTSGIPHARLAADGDRVEHAGQVGSRVLVTGDDLALPAGATPGSGTRVRVRSSAYVIDELALAAVDGRRLLLAAPTSEPASAGWGYLLSGEAWMLDHPGEWHHDAPAGRLALWLPDGIAPGATVAATVLERGVDLGGRSHLVIDGLRLRRLGTAAWLRGAHALVLRNLRIDDSADRAIDAADSRELRIESCRIRRSGLDAIYGGGIGAPPASGMQVLDNRIAESGVRLRGDRVVSLPRRSLAAVLAGESATVRGNVVRDSGYIGIRVWGGSLVEANLVTGACRLLDDCAGVYTLGEGNGSTIRGNVVIGTPGFPWGNAGQPGRAQGIYLDDFASEVTVEDNTVAFADHGIQLHAAAGNRLRGNRLFGNRRAQIWLQEGRGTVGRVHDNAIEANLLVPPPGDALALRLESAGGASAGFARFCGNRLAEWPGQPLVRADAPDGARDLSLAGWQAAWPGLPGEPDARAWPPGLDRVVVDGPEQVANPAFANGAAGWSSWSPGRPDGRLLAERSPLAPALRYLPGAAPGLLSSPHFSLEAGRWYRLGVDLSADHEAQPVRLVVRRGGGGDNGYERLSRQDLALTAGRDWRRHERVFEAATGVRAGDPRTGDLGARIDFEQLLPGRSLALARPSLVPVRLRTAEPWLLVRATGRAEPLPCPFTSEADCAAAVDDEGRPVSWPLALPPLGARIVWPGGAGTAPTPR